MKHLLERIKIIAAPVLEQPVLIIESDDWGPGPETHAHALDQIRGELKRHTDHTGRHPVMTIGVVLSIPDMPRIQETGRYAARYLHESEFRSIVDALKKGADEGVFYLQLHGMAHYWPDNLMTELERNPALVKSLTEVPWLTETMPSWLQSRWIDGRQLPSAPMPATAIDQAVAGEVQEFERCFGFRPKVAVPPTFVWNEEVEHAYARHGIEVLITPGRRYTGRDAEGRLTPPDQVEINGARFSCGLVTLVRDLYFEPALGHTPTELLPQIERKWTRREPALLETHRFNFVDEAQRSSALRALNELLEKVVVQSPETRFLNPLELAGQLHRHRPVDPWHHAAARWRRLRA